MSSLPSVLSIIISLICYGWNHQFNLFEVIIYFLPSQLTFSCSKSTIESLEKGVKYVQNYQYKHQNDVQWLWTCVSIVDFEQVNVSWDVSPENIRNEKFFDIFQMALKGNIKVFISKERESFNPF